MFPEALIVSEKDESMRSDPIELMLCDISMEPDSIDMSVAQFLHCFTNPGIGDPSFQ